MTTTVRDVSGPFTWKDAADVKLPSHAGVLCRKGEPVFYWYANGRYFETQNPNLIGTIQGG